MGLRASFGSDVIVCIGDRSIYTHCAILILTGSFSVSCLHSIIYGGTFGNTHVLLMTNILYQTSPMSQAASTFYLFRVQPDNCACHAM